MADEIFDVSEEYERIVAEHYTKKESIALQKFLNRDKLVRNIICTVIVSLLLIFFSIIKAEWYIIAITFAVMCSMLWHTYKTVSTIKTGAKKLFENKVFRIEWLVYSDRLVYKAYRGDKEEVSYSIEPNKISLIKDLGDCFVFEYMQNIFSVSKSIAAEGTTFFKLLFPSGKAKDKTPIAHTCSLMYDCVGMLTFAYVAVAITTFVPNPALWWVALIGLPFPIAMMIMLIVFRLKGIKINVNYFDLLWAIAIVVLTFYSLLR